MNADRWSAIEKWIAEARVWVQYRKRCGDELDAQRWQDAVDDAQRVLVEERHAAALAKVRRNAEAEIAKAFDDVRYLRGIAKDNHERLKTYAQQRLDALDREFVDETTRRSREEQRKSMVAIAKAQQPIRKDVVWEKGRIVTVTEYRGDVPVLRKHVSYIPGTGKIASVREEKL